MPISFPPSASQDSQHQHCGGLCLRGPRFAGGVSSTPGEHKTKLPPSGHRQDAQPSVQRVRNCSAPGGLPSSPLRSVSQPSLHNHTVLTRSLEACLSHNTLSDHGSRLAMLLSEGVRVARASAGPQSRPAHSRYLVGR